jgi:hypothetical protein
MSGFHGPYTIPDTATAVVGVLLAVAVLATAGAAGQPGQYIENRCTIDREPSGDPQRTPARSSLPPHTGLIGGAGGAGVLQLVKAALRRRVEGGQDVMSGPDRRRRPAARHGAPAP